MRNRQAMKVECYGIYRVILITSCSFSFVLLYVLNIESFGGV